MPLSSTKKLKQMDLFMNEKVRHDLTLFSVKLWKRQERFLLGMCEDKK